MVKQEVNIWEVKTKIQEEDACFGEKTKQKAQKTLPLRTVKRFVSMPGIFCLQRN